MWKEFKEFAFKGNVFDLAVAVVIGASFNAIVTSFVDHILTPIIGMLSGGINLNGLKLTFNDAEIMYGSFIQSFVDFFITAFSIFVAIRFLNRFKHKEEAEVEEKIDVQQELLTEIRDLLKQQNEKI